MKELKYVDVALIPRRSQLSSRAEADPSVRLGPKKFKLPVVPANMKSVISTRLAQEMSEAGYFYIMHRFGICPIEFCREAKDWETLSLSVGVKQKDFQDVEMISAQAREVDFITIDIAHGHSSLVKDMIGHIKHQLPDSFIIAGNVATPEAVNDLARWGAHCAKVGIGQGNVCTTKDKTGFTRPMFSTVLDCSQASSQLPIIADGGIRFNGDITKSLVAGASMAMAGSLFSQCMDSPAVSTIIGGKIYKQYFGSASEHNKNTRKHIEGVMKEMPTNNLTYFEKLQEIQQDLQSSISYAGGTDISTFSKTLWKIV
jgi:GMP reductase